MAIRLAINGFGRIGRLVLRAVLERHAGRFEIVAVNDLTDAPTLAHLFRRDSVHGRYDGTVEERGGQLVIDGTMTFPVLSEREPANLPWKDLDVDVVVESTGFFRSHAAAQKHIDAGAKRVIISAPAKDAVDATVVLGVNDDILTGKEKIISNASCTTNCLAPMVKVLDDAFGVKSGLMTTLSGVNVTLGLPIIRTSVDHGTAFDIAGQGIANDASMIESIELAAKMVKARKQRS